MYSRHLPFWIIIHSSVSCTNALHTKVPKSSISSPYLRSPWPSTTLHIKLAPYPHTVTAMVRFLDIFWCSNSDNSIIFSHSQKWQYHYKQSTFENAQLDDVQMHSMLSVDHPQTIYTFSDKFWICTKDVRKWKDLFRYARNLAHFKNIYEDLLTYLTISATSANVR